MKRLSPVVCAIFSVFFFTTAIEDDVLKLSAKFPGGIYATGLFFCLLLFWGWLLSLPRTKGAAVTALSGIVALLFSVFSLGGLIYTKEDISRSILSMLRGNAENRLPIAVFLIGGFLLFWNLIVRFPALVERLCSGSEEAGALQPLYRFLFGKGGWIRRLLVVLAVWVPQMIIRYPGGITEDAFASLGQYMGLYPYSTAQPLIYTLIVGKFIDLGLALGQANYGAYLMVLCQCAAAIGAIFYTGFTLKRLNAPRLLQAFSFLLLTLRPTLSSTALSGIKDAPFLIAYLLMTDEVLYFLFSDRETPIPPYRWAVALLAGFFMVMRNNGPLMLLMMIALLALREVVVGVRLRKGFRRDRIILLTALMLSSLLLTSGSKIAAKKLDATPSTTRVRYALVIQQIGRCVYLHADDITDEEMETMQKVFRYPKDVFFRQYNALNFDGLKNGFNEQASGKDILGYLSVWLKLVMRHPATCFAATAHQNYILFTPLDTTVSYGGRLSSAYIRDTRRYTYDFSEMFHDVRALRASQNQMISLFRKLDKLPVLSLLGIIGLHTLLLAACVIHALVKGRWDFLILSMLPLMILGFTFLGPAIMGHSRYVLPMMLTMPVWVFGFSRAMEETAPAEKI